METAAEDGPDDSVHKLPKYYIWFVITFSVIQLSLVATVEELGSLFLSRYLVKSQIQMKEDKASYLVGMEAFWFTVGRLINMLCSLFMPTFIIHGVAVLLIVIGYSLMSQIGFNQYGLVIAAMALTGIGEAPVFPLTMSFLEKRVRITGRIQMIIQLVGTIVTTLSIFAIGNQIEVNPQTFAFFAITFGAFMCFIYILLVVSDFWKSALLKKQELDQVVLVG